MNLLGPGFREVSVIHSGPGFHCFLGYFLGSIKLLLCFLDALLFYFHYG